MAASTEVQTPRVVSDQLFLPSEESHRTSYLLIAHLCVMVDKLQLDGGAKSAAEGYVQRSRFLGVLPGNPGGVAQSALTKNSVAGPWLILNEGLVAGLTAQGLVVVGVGDLSYSACVLSTASGVRNWCAASAMKRRRASTMRSMRSLCRLMASARGTTSRGRSAASIGVRSSSGRLRMD